MKAHLIAIALLGFVINSVAQDLQEKQFIKPIENRVLQ